VRFHAMGAYLSQPNTEKHSEDGEGPANLGIRYGVSEMQGWRMHMEVRSLFSSVCACACAWGSRVTSALSPPVPRMRAAGCSHYQARVEEGLRHRHVCSF
jgi:hypothetical protein